MSDTQPRALLLASALGMVDSLTELPELAAEELRRLHKENKQLENRLYDALGQLHVANLKLAGRQTFKDAEDRIARSPQGLIDIGRIFTPEKEQSEPPPEFIDALKYDVARRDSEAQPERVQLTVKDFVTTVGGIEDAVGTPIYWAEWPNKEQMQ